MRPVSILEDFRNAPSAKMLIYCQKLCFNFMKDKIDKSRHLALFIKKIETL